jgi:amino acid permease
MATWLPVPGAIPTFCSRFVDEAMGFAVGWNVRARSGETSNVQGTNQ